MKNSTLSLPILFTLSVIIFSISACKKTTDNPAMEWNLPYFGFNAKGTLDVNEQTNLADNYFTQIPAGIKTNITLRVTGGTLSQTTFNSYWTDAYIQQWGELQRKQGLRFIYVVNGNDASVNQKQVIQRWIDAGVKFDFLEMMNEYYLPKYALGETQNEEVTEKVSPKKYVDTILPNFFNQLDGFNLPYYVILAPTGTGNVQAYFQAWNDSIINAIKTTYASRNLNATLHLYLRGAGSNFDYEQVRQLKMRLPVSSHLAITEAGVIDTTLNNQQAGLAAIEHYKKIIPLLSKGDYLLDQVLYNNSQDNNAANLSPAFNGITPKGNLMLTFINNYLK